MTFWTWCFRLRIYLSTPVVSRFWRHCRIPVCMLRIYSHPTTVERSRWNVRGERWNPSSDRRPGHPGLHAGRHWRPGVGLALCVVGGHGHTDTRHLDVEVRSVGIHFLLYIWKSKACTSLSTILVNIHEFSSKQSQIWYSDIIITYGAWSAAVTGKWRLHFDVVFWR
jgi:hypothetical protein